MFYLYDATNTSTYIACARDWRALRSHIHNNKLSNHIITNGQIKPDHSNIIKAA